MSPASSTSASAARRSARRCWSTRSAAALGGYEVAVPVEHRRRGVRRGGRAASTRRRRWWWSRRRPSPPPKRWPTCDAALRLAAARRGRRSRRPADRGHRGAAKPRSTPGSTRPASCLFGEGVGGRYSLWSSVGFPAALALGWDAFEELLEGAAEMDRHFRFADAGGQRRRCSRPSPTGYYVEQLRLPRRARSSPMTSGCGCCRPISSSSRWNRTASRSRADGTPVDRPTAPITWGGTGTDAQHAVFQLLHQGTHLGSGRVRRRRSRPDDAHDPEHHRQLLLNASPKARR